MAFDDSVESFLDELQEKETATQEKNFQNSEWLSFN
jgi:hypothetical protein